MQFDWDDANRTHISRHGIEPSEAEEVILNDPFDLEEQMVDGEQRYSELGETRAQRILVVVITWNGDIVRVVTAYDAPLALRRQYLYERGSQWHS